MSRGTGRNDPCPCGSGRKYKKCCLQRQQHEDRSRRAAATAKEHRNEVFSIALSWLKRHYETQVQAAFDEFGTAAAADGRELSRADEEYLLVQATEWVVAEGVAQVGGREVRLRDLVLDRGPLLDADQRKWLEAATEQPLRLWRVSRVQPGVGLELENLLDDSSEPVWVQERSASRSLERTSAIAARLARWDGAWELSCAYQIPEVEVLDLVGKLEASVEGDPSDPKAAHATGKRIRDYWVWLMTRRRTLPRVVDAAGNRIELTTDHWQILDRDELERRLAAESDVVGSPGDGWARLEEPSAEMSRSLYALNPGRSDDRLELFARTRALADEGRAWLERLAGSCVRHLAREIVDPMSDEVLGGAETSEGTLSVESFAIHSVDSGEDRTRLMESLYRRQYAGLADDPVPILGNKTPKQVLEQPGGERKVRLWLEQFERSEAQMAAADGRESVSLDFLWREVGLERGER